MSTQKYLQVVQANQNQATPDSTDVMRASPSSSLGSMGDVRAHLFEDELRPDSGLGGLAVPVDPHSEYEELAALFDYAKVDSKDLIVGEMLGKAPFRPFTYVVLMSPLASS